MKYTACLHRPAPPILLTKYDFLSSRAANVEQINSKIDKSVKNVNVLRSMVEHVDEYIYYRTDHHWTHLGAYYGYTELMKARNRQSEIIPLSKYSENLSWKVISGFIISRTLHRPITIIPIP